MGLFDLRYPVYTFIESKKILVFAFKKIYAILETRMDNEYIDEKILSE